MNNRLVCLMASVLTLTLAASRVFAVGAVTNNMVAEMSFRTNIPPNVEGIYSMDIYPTNTVGQMMLIGTNTSVQTSITNAPTEIGTGWVDALRDGYLSVPSRANVGTLNYVGMRSITNAMRDYIGSSGFSAVTLYFVVSPKSDWKNATRRSLFGTGHYQAGWVEVDNYNGAVSLNCGINYTVSSVLYRQYCKLNITNTWVAGTWYFIGASWEKEKEPVLYVRQMAVKGPNFSMSALTNSYFTTGTSYTNTVPVNGQYSYPLVSGATTAPLTVGCYSYNASGTGGSDNGADANFAYFRVDKAYEKLADMEAVFFGLGRPSQGTIIGLQ